MIACEEGNLEIIKQLIQIKECNINMKESDTKLSSLMLAITNNHIEIVKFLLSYINHETILNDINDSKQNIISISCENNSEECLSYLLSYAVESNFDKKEFLSWINQPNDEGKSPLFFTCAYNNEKMTKLLLQSNANPNQQDDNGITPLFISTQNGNLSIVEQLIQYHGDVNISRYEDGISCLHLACLLGHFDLIPIILHSNANINQQSLHGETPLFIACQENHLDVVKKLLSEKANVNISLFDGTSPLLDVCENDSLSSSSHDLIKLLLESNADINHKRPCDGMTPKDIIPGFFE